MSIQPLENTYVLKAGDSLESLSAELYDTIENFRDIADANELDIFEPLPVGQKINIPTAEEIQAIAESLLPDVLDDLDLSAVKDPVTNNPFQLVSWII